MGGDSPTDLRYNENNSLLKLNYNVIRPKEKLKWKLTWLIKPGRTILKKRQKKKVMEKIEAELKIHGGGRIDCDLGVELERVGKGSFQ